MKPTKTATLRRETGWIVIDCPYSATFVAELKEAIPARERTWDRPYWRVLPKHLEIVRALLAETAQHEQWKMLDYTTESKDVIEYKESIVRDDVHRHVTAVIAVLAKLPPRTLRLVDWRKGELIIELAVFLEDKDLFKELAEASLEHYRPTIIYGGMHKREFAHTFVLLADDRILRALCAYAGTSPLEDTEGHRSGVEYLNVRDLSLERMFENDVAHFIDGNGGQWVGIPHQNTNIDFSWSRDKWQVTIISDTVYLVFQREQIIQRFIATQTRIAKFLRYAHMEEWFCSSVHTLMQDDRIAKSLAASKEGWWVSDWKHPADEMISYLFTTRHPDDLLALLGWTEETLYAHRNRIEALKQKAVADGIASMKEHAGELALPRLESLVVKELLPLAEKYHVEVKKAWTKEKIITALRGDSLLCEEVIGLTKRMEQR